MTADPSQAAPVDPELAVILGRLAIFQGQPTTVTALPGGLTNHNYKVVTADGAYVVRVSPADADLLAIDREVEYRNSVLAAAHGVGAEVIEYLPGHGVMVVEFIEGTTLTEADFARPGVLGRAATACRRLHDGPRFVNEFNMFDVRRRYLNIIEEHGLRIPAGYRDYHDQVAALETILARTAEPIVPCNNDLLAANFIDTGTEIRLIDYEYSGNNDPCFELGNIWSECQLDLDQLDELITVYYGRPRPSRLARAQLQGLMSRYGWTLWACIRQATAERDFDFWSWGMAKYEAARQTFDGPEFGRLLDAVQLRD